MNPCRACLRRTWLVGLLSASIGAELARRRRRGPLLALPDDELVDAVGGSRRSDARRMLDSFDRSSALEAIACVDLEGVCRHDPRYPQQLLELADPPALLCSSAPPGRLAELCGAPSVAVVGTRRASPYGLEVASALGRGLAAAGVTVVSGLALGIDAAAHRGAIAAGGPTLAVLGCGADTVYPRANRALYRQVREHGAIVSELPPGQPPNRWTFPARNRIMAGIAAVTVVVEAAERSGSLITASFAQELGRDVCAVPGRVTSRIAAGANQLLLDGAHPVRGAADVLDLLFGVGGWPGADRAPTGSAERGLDAATAGVLRVVEDASPLDDATRELDLSPSELRAALGRLELLGLVRRTALGAYERVAGA